MTQQQKPIRQVGGGTGASVLRRALDILHACSIGHLEGTVPELAEAIGESQSTVYRSVKVLLERKLLERGHRENTYRPSLQLLKLTRSLRRCLPMAAAGLPVLEILAPQAGVTLHLWAPYGDKIMCLETVHSRPGLRVVRTPGTVLPYHAISAGKVLLAWAPPEVVTAVLAGSLPKLAPNTVTDPVELSRQLTEIRSTGYAVTVEELGPGVAGGAVPIFRGDGSVAGALSFSCPVECFTQEAVTEWLQFLRSGAVEISNRLGILEGV